VHAGVFFTEVANLLFFVGTGFKFQPMENNPYLPVSTDMEEEEFGLAEDSASTGTELALRNRMLVSV
jgi:hypothetical protein